LINFFDNWFHGWFTFDGKFSFPPDTEEPEVNWPYGCEIDQAIKTKSESGFGMAARRFGAPNTVADITTLVTRLSESNGPDFLSLIERYGTEYEWYSDYDFVVRYFVNSFVD